MYKPDWTFIGSQVKAYRHRSQLLQSQLAKKLGITQTHLSNMESGRVRINLEHLMLMANLFHCRLDDLVLPGEERQTEGDISEKDVELAVRLLKALKGVS